MKQIDVVIVVDQSRISQFTLKLMDIDSENLAIPNQDYKCEIKMPSEEFKRICGLPSFFFIILNSYAVVE